MPVLSIAPIHASNANTSKSEGLKLDLPQIVHPFKNGRGSVDLLPSLPLIMMRLAGSALSLRHREQHSNWVGSHYLPEAK